MDPVHEISFAYEAESALRTLRALILVHRQAERPLEVQQHAAEIGRLGVSAAEAGLAAAAEVLHSLEEDLARAHSSAHSPDDPLNTRLLDSITRAEAEIVKILMEHSDQFPDPSDLAVLSLGPMWADGPAGAQAGPVENDLTINDEDVYEPDDEMLEIFAQEADELLNNIENCIEALNARPGDKEAVWELRRHAHTFKGAAGIIGLKEPSRLAHRVEDVLDDLANREIVPDARVIGLITVAAGHLRLLTDRGQGNPGVERTEQLYNAFDEIMRDLRGQGHTAGPSGAAPDTSSVGDDTAAETGAPAPRPIVRVAINRLDDLVLTVRDLVVSRSVIEQRLIEYADLLESLTAVTRKLQAATAEIEIDHEAALLEHHAPVRFDHTFATDPETPSGNYDRFDALELDRYTDFHDSARQLSEAARELFTVSTALDNLRSGFESVLSEQHRLIDDAQTKVAQIRLIRFDSISTRLQRAVRVACEEEGKTAEITIENPETELDTDVLDSLVEPLMHLIRNAVAHGIEPPETRRLVGKAETGSISVGISDEETYVELTVRDDGHGIDASALRRRAAEMGMAGPEWEKSAIPDAAGILDLMCLPGLTTAEKLSMSAGRGVGMGIVKESVEARRGSISVETAQQRGTAFTVRLPVSFSVTRALVVRAGDHFAAIPARMISQMIDTAAADLSSRDGRDVLTVGGRTFAVNDLRDHFAVGSGGPGVNDPSVVLLLNCRGARLALKVDEVLKISKLAVKPVGRPIDGIKGLLGIAISGSGTVLPVLDVQHFATAAPARPAEKLSGYPGRKPTALVVDDSASVRQMTSRMVVAAGWDVVTAKDGVEALEVLREKADIRIVFTDVEMPRMDGYSLTEALRRDERLSRIPVVFITSRGGEKHREKAAELGVTEYLTKPFFETDLLAVVGRISAAQQTSVI